MSGNGVLATCCFGISSSNMVSRHQQDALHRFTEVENLPMMLLIHVIFRSEEIG